MFKRNDIIKCIRKPERGQYPLKHTKCVGLLYRVRSYAEHNDTVELYGEGGRFRGSNFVLTDEQNIQPLTEFEWLDRVQQNFKE